MHLEACFVVHFVNIQHSFSCIVHIRDGNDFSQFGRTEVNETQGYATESLHIIHYFTRYADTGTTIPLYVIICHSRQITHPYQN